MKTEYLQIRITKILKDAVREAAEEEEKGISEWVTDLIKEELKKREPD